MRNLLHIQFTFVLLFGIIGFGQQLDADLAENQGMSSTRLSNIDYAFTNYIDNDKLPGSVILVW